MRHPIAILGAGPVGLAVAAHTVQRGLDFVFAGAGAVGAAMLQWGHVRLFSPWCYTVDAAARALLDAQGWQSPEDEALPTGAEIVRDYLTPLGKHPAIAPHMRTGTRATAISRAGHGKLGSDRRDMAPFVIHRQDAAGQAGRTLARAVIDTTGTWGAPNPIGLDGLPVPGEAESANRITYGIPDVNGAEQDVYAGRHILVIGAGHSAINAVLDLMALQSRDPSTRITWATRRGGNARLQGGGLNDALPGRGQLGLRATEAIASGRLTLLSPCVVERIYRSGDGLMVAGRHGSAELAVTVDRIIVTTGYRPDLAPLRELRLALDPVVEAPTALAPLIDPNLHSCGTVPPHGVLELTHPERDFYIVGMKSYGRAPTFLMLTGYEQVRSVVAGLAGDPVAARKVQLVLPKTGVCSIPQSVPESCCCGPAPETTDACCRRDAEAKAAGDTGCGCATAARDACCGQVA